MIAPTFVYHDDNAIEPMAFPAFFVVDDFYQNAVEVRAFAVESSYKKSILSGTQSLMSTRRYPFSEEVLDRIGQLIDVIPYYEGLERAFQFWGEISCGEFQLSLENNSTPGAVHSHKNGEWVGIVYLSRPEDCKNKVGTYIMRHKETGTFRWDSISDDLYSKLKSDSRNPESWEIIFAPEMKFNRLFLFDSRFFHAESAGFGTGAKNGRLVHIFNFTTVKTRRNS